MEHTFEQQLFVALRPSAIIVEKYIYKNVSYNHT